LLWLSIDLKINFCGRDCLSWKNTALPSLQLPKNARRLPLPTPPGLFLPRDAWSYSEGTICGTSHLKERKKQNETETSQS
jgi:hypothetical protein